MDYNKEVICKKVGIALDVFYEKDIDLINLKLHERTIAHKFAEYLQVLFPEFDVDCEYDKKGEKRKDLQGIRECSNRRTTDWVLPDIIIHKRNSNYNLVVFELKSKKSSISCDLKKLKLFTSQESECEYKYKFGLFIYFKSEIEDCKIRLFMNGLECDINDN
jgi:hypothetical protein